MSVKSLKCLKSPKEVAVLCRCFYSMIDGSSDFNREVNTLHDQGVSTVYHVIRYTKGSFLLADGLVLYPGEVHCYQPNWSCVASTDKKQLLKCSKYDVSAIEHNKTVELSAEEGKWEGDAYNGKPCGWGLLYDRNGNMIYEGFRIDAVNTCFGTRYYPENHQIEYTGNIYMGKRWGRGMQYDRNGKVIYNGEWINDDHVKKVDVAHGEESKVTYHTRIMEMVFEDYAFYNKHFTKLNLTVFMGLRMLTIDDDCFSYVEETYIKNMPHLETLHIGANSFNLQDDFGEGSGKFFLQNCPALKEFVVGSKSFASYRECIMENLPSLETLSMGKMEEEESDCFWYSSIALRSEGRRRE